MSPTIRSFLRMSMNNFTWAVQPVDYLANHQVVSGTDNLIYSPAEALTRADFVTMLTRAYSDE